MRHELLNDEGTFLFKNHSWLLVVITSLAVSGSATSLVVIENNYI